METIEQYRKRKREYARTPDQKAKRVAYARLWRARNREHYNSHVKRARALRRQAAGLPPVIPRPPVMSPEEALSRRRKKQREAKAKWRAAHRERANEQSNRAYHKYKHRYKAKFRAKHLLKKYGLTSEQWEQLFEAQGKCCSICKRADAGSRRGWHVDHCHVTGKVRGILCHVCNTKLGWLEKFRQPIETYLRG